MYLDNNFRSFLDSKSQDYSEIDVDRFPKIFEKISLKLKYPKIIHIIGTNGKGSTGRTLAFYMYKSGYNVGHYSSPHILDFNERIWINNQNITYIRLQELHEDALKLLSKDDLKSLSYFEYTTLLAIISFQTLDYAIVEAGLGGEFDATHVLKKDLSIITPIGLDHQSFLGNTIEEIAQTKINSIDNSAIIYNAVDSIMLIAKQKATMLYKSIDFLDKSELKEIDKYIANNHFATYLSANIALALSAVKFFGLKFDINYLSDLELFGRYYKYKSNIILDVGHNELAAYAIKKELKDRKINLIYNSFYEKNYKKILEILAKNIDELLIINITNDRITKSSEIKKVASNLNIKYSNYKKINKEKNYLVFGSFSVIERFLEIEQK